jgi:hypothetical protein
MLYKALTIPCINISFCQALESNGEEDPVKASAAAMRLNGVQKSFGTLVNRVPSRGSLLDSTNTVIGPTTSASELETIRTSTSKGMWTVYYSVCRGHAIDASLGNGTVMFASDKTMLGRKACLYLYV